MFRGNIGIVSDMGPETVPVRKFARRLTCPLKRVVQVLRALQSHRHRISMSDGFLDRFETWFLMHSDISTATPDTLTPIETKSSMILSPERTTLTGLASIINSTSFELAGPAIMS